MRDPDWRVRFDAAGALGAYDDETTRRALEQYGGKHMENEHPYVRSRLVRILND
jgi:HEAT repeat protein